MKKRIILICISAVLLLSLITLVSCSGNSPELDDVKDRFIYLIEGSKELNTIYFGKGLPVYDREGLLEEQMGVYYNDTLTSYDRVMENSKYLTVDEIKERSSQIYSTEYLNSLYETAFDGVMTGSSSAYLRFYEVSDWLYQNSYATDFGIEERIYDYSTMKIVTPSNNEYVNVTIESYSLNDKTVREVSLTFVFERGNWYLDSPTY